MKYGTYTNTRNSAWQCLIDCNISELPIKTVKIAKLYNLQCKKADNKVLHGDAGKIKKINGVATIIFNSENIRSANQRYGPGSDASALIPPDGKTKYRPDFLYCPAQDSTLNVTCDILTNPVCNLYVFLPHQIHPHAVQQCNTR